MRIARLLPAFAVVVLAVMGSGPEARAEWIRVHSNAVVGGGYDTNPLLLGTAQFPSSVSSAGASANVEMGFGHFTRVYTQGGAFYSALPAVGLSTTTGFGEVRFLRRVSVLDLEARVGASLSDVAADAQPGALPPKAPPGAPVFDLDAIARTGDSTSMTGALSVSSRPATVRGGVAAFVARTVFPQRFALGSTRPEEVSQAGGLGFVDYRRRGIATSLGGRATRQTSLRAPENGTSGDLYAGVWLEPHPEVVFRVRGEARTAWFPQDGEKGRVDAGAVGQLGVSLGRPGRVFRLDLAATWMQVSSSRNDFRAQRIGVSTVLQIQPKAWSR